MESRFVDGPGFQGTATEAVDLRGNSMINGHQAAYTSLERHGDRLGHISCGENHNQGICKFILITASHLLCIQGQPWTDIGRAPLKFGDPAAGWARVRIRP